MSVLDFGVIRSLDDIYWGVSTLKETSRFFQGWVVCMRFDSYSYLFFVSLRLSRDTVCVWDFCCFTSLIYCFPCDIREETVRPSFLLQDIYTRELCGVFKCLAWLWGIKGGRGKWMHGFVNLDGVTGLFLSD